MTEIRKIELGTMRYGEALDVQRELFEAVINKEKSALVLVEHPHVYTLGKSGDVHNMLRSEEFLQKIGAEFVHTDRGGDITYHGYGQLVIYPILNINELDISLRQYIFLLEESIIDTINHFGIKGGRMEGATGVWIDGDLGNAASAAESDGSCAGASYAANVEAMENRPMPRKIAAIGVKASRGVTMHGAALNVTTDLGYFSHINPCGFVDRGVTSIAKELADNKIDRTVDLNEVSEVFCRCFAKNYGVRLIDSTTKNGVENNPKETTNIHI